MPKRSHVKPCTLELLKFLRSMCFPPACCHVGTNRLERYVSLCLHIFYCVYVRLSWRAKNKVRTYVHTGIIHITSTILWLEDGGRSWEVHEMQDAKLTYFRCILLQLCRVSSLCMCLFLLKCWNKKTCSEEEESQISSGRHWPTNQYFIQSCNPILVNISRAHV